MGAYTKGGYTGKAATCHPNRRAFVDTHCRECWQGERLPASDLPPRTLGVIQHAFTRWPEECAHCGAKANALYIEGRRVECFQCGWTGHLTSDQATIPRWPRERKGEAYAHVRS